MNIEANKFELENKKLENVLQKLEGDFSDLENEIEKLIEKEVLEEGDNAVISTLFGAIQGISKAMDYIRTELGYQVDENGVFDSVDTLVSFARDEIEEM